MNVLGLNCFSHNSSACVISDAFMACAEEERLTREKQTAAYPVNAIGACLRQLGLSPGDLDALALPMSPSQRARKAAYSLGRFMRTGDVGPLRADVREAEILVRRSRLAAGLPAGKPGGRRGLRTHFVEHHLAHAASAFFSSPFDEAAILTVDGIGDWRTGLLAYGRGSEIKILRQLTFPQSLGKLYSSVCRYLGYHGSAKEGTVMALAALGSQSLNERFCDLVQLIDDGTFRLDLSYFRFGWTLDSRSEVSPKFVAEFGPSRSPDAELTQRHADIANGLQSLFEIIYFHLLRSVAARSSARNVCIAGGAALNSVANGKVLDKTRFRDLFVQPAANDAGLALGAALWVRARQLGPGQARLSMRADLGPEFSAPEISETLKGYSDLSVERPGDLSGTVARSIADGNLVGWFQGRMEFGPRALGNRSILADPRRPESRERVNRAIKERESFRPFAAAILHESVGEFLELPLPDAARFMLTVHELRKDCRAQLPAIVHVDGTCRMQVVARDANPVFYDLIRGFARITGFPLLLNTSFNRRDEPIVCTPQDAISCFLDAGLDSLVMGPFVVRREGR